MGTPGFEGQMGSSVETNESGFGDNLARDQGRSFLGQSAGLVPFSALNRTLNAQLSTLNRPTVVPLSVVFWSLSPLVI